MGSALTSTCACAAPFQDQGAQCPVMLRVSIAAMRLHRGRRPKAFNEGTRGRWQAAASAERYGGLRAMDTSTHTRGRISGKPRRPRPAFCG